MRRLEETEAKEEEIKLRKSKFIVSSKKLIDVHVRESRILCEMRREGLSC